jgi:hypothetical protein
MTHDFEGRLAKRAMLRRRAEILLENADVIPLTDVEREELARIAATRWPTPADAEFLRFFRSTLRGYEWT